MFSGILIGNQTTITRSNVRSLEGFSGEIVDETKNTLSVRQYHSKVTIVVPKSIVDFEMTDTSRRIRAFAGKDLIASSPERINKL